MSAALGSEKPGVAGAFEALNIAAVKVSVVSSFVLGLMFETTGGCSTRVTSALVRTFEKLLPETVPWLEIEVALVGLLIVTENLTKTVFPGGNVPMLTGEPRKCVPDTLPGIAPMA